MKTSEHWTATAKAALLAGQTVAVKPIGKSMTGLISSGDTVTLAPCETENVAVGEIVLVEIQGRRYSHLVLHLVKARDEGKFLIGANNGRIDGWVGPEKIFGRAIERNAASGDNGANVIE